MWFGNSRPATAQSNTLIWSRREQVGDGTSIPLFTMGKNRTRARFGPNMHENRRKLDQKTRFIDYWKICEDWRVLSSLRRSIILWDFDFRERFSNFEETGESVVPSLSSVLPLPLK